MTDPGATPLGARSLAPDLARGGMLLLIALANAHFYRYGPPPGPPAGGVDRVLTLLQGTLVDGRAYPLFGLLFGYGIGQLAARRGALGLPATAVTRLVRRRGAWMIVIGSVHGVLLWSGDIVGAYGLLAVLLAGPLVRGSSGGLAGTAATGAALVALLFSTAGIQVGDAQRPPLESVAIPDPAAALAARAGEWVGIGLLTQALGVFGAVAAGAWAARRRLLDDPDRHRTTLRRAAGGGIALAVVGGLPLALLTAGWWTPSSLSTLLLAGSLHAVGGYAGGVGYAALFGLLAVRIATRGGPGPVARAVQACGQRSLSCYLAQSVAFVALLPAWTLGLGRGATPWQTALVGFSAWLVILLIAAHADRIGYRGPAETLLRRLTYGPRPTTISL